MLFVSLVFSALLLGLVFWVGFRNRSVLSACMTAGFLSLLFLLLPLVPSMAAYLTLPLGFAAGIVAALFRLGMRAYVVLTVCATLGMYAYFVVGALQLREMRNRLRAANPYESIAERLAYERQGAGTNPVDGPVAAPMPVAMSAQGGLAFVEDAIEQRLFENPRDYALKALHDNAVSEFTDSFGFGSMRMVRFRRSPERFMELPPDEPIPQPPPESFYGIPSYEDALPIDIDLTDADVTKPPDLDSLARMHRSGYLDFTNPEGFGHIKDLEHVAGFQSHRFRMLPEVASGDSISRRWRLARLELVSLLKHDPPAVYVSEYLPRMDELRDAPTRPLDLFERANLETLLGGEELAVVEDVNEIRVLGAVRAVKQCVECHDVERGALLGAFSYRLVRDPPLRVLEGNEALDGPQTRLRSTYDGPVALTVW